MFYFNYFLIFAEPEIKVIAYLFVGIMGALMGSFLTCVADRYVAKESISKGRSHCDYCGHELGFGDLIPILSYLIHGGKCKYCKKKLSPKYLFLELGMAVIFVLALWQHGLSLYTLSLLIVYCLLLPASLIDIQTMELPDRYFIGIIICWGLTLIPSFSWELFLDSIYGGFGAALAVFLLSLLLNKVLGKETMGFGDIKLMLAMGLHLGLYLTIVNLILACIIGIIVILVLKAKDRPTPFGPSLSAAFVITSLFGHHLLRFIA